MQARKKKVFLSHKGVDKEIVHDFKKTLELFGYMPWLDEDAMPAGTQVDRGILNGMKESCGVVFFITPSFKDEGYLEVEINYAIAEKRSKKDRFSIIALLFENDNGDMGNVPELLRPYVWKTPKTHLQALREIVRALPLTVGGIDWRKEIGGVATKPIVKSTSAELSNEAKVLLTKAASGGGRILYLRHLSGTSIHAGNTQMLESQDQRLVALWVGGLEDLERRRFIKDSGHKREVFVVTREGFSAADELSKEK